MAGMQQLERQGAADGAGDEEMQREKKSQGERRKCRRGGNAEGKTSQGEGREISAFQIKTK